MTTSDDSASRAERDGTVAFLLLRLFFAQFWVLQFVGKLTDADSRVVAWSNLALWSKNTTEWFVKLTVLPGWFVAPYTSVVPYCELAIGVLLAIGLATRGTLIFSGLLLITLDAGMMLQLKHEVVGTNTIYLLAILLAVHLEKYNRWSVDSLRR